MQEVYLVKLTCPKDNLKIEEIPVKNGSIKIVV